LLSKVLTPEYLTVLAVLQWRLMKQHYSR
jgi:hypothetical protein